MRKKTPGSLNAANFNAANFNAVDFATGAKLFTDRNYVIEDDLPALAGARFLQIPLDGRKSLKCERAGTVWFLTPTPDRNKDSCAAELTRQGFTKVAVPEVRLFNPKSTANFCTLYQKDCEPGEAIEVGKWAVPLFLP